MLYLLEPIKPWTPWYDKVFVYVICANDEQEARQLASNQAEAEGMDVWLDKNITFCTPVTDDSSRVILRDHRRS
jgi:hypothetical protein